MSTVATLESSSLTGTTQDSFNSVDERQLRENFAHFDIDGSGVLEPDEAIACAQELGYPYDSACIRHIMNLSQSDEDLETLSFDEFRRFVALLVRFDDSVSEHVRCMIEKRIGALDPAVLPPNKETIEKLNLRLLKYVTVREGDVDWSLISAKLTVETAIWKHQLRSSPTAAESKGETELKKEQSQHETKKERETKGELKLLPLKKLEKRSLKTKKEVQAVDTLKSEAQEVPGDLIDRRNRIELLLARRPSLEGSLKAERDFKNSLARTRSLLRTVDEKPQRKTAESWRETKSLEVSTSSKESETETESEIDILNLDSEERVWIEDAFDLFLQFYDCDGSGTIDNSQLGAAMRALGLDARDDDVRRAVAKHDRNRSGDVDFVEFALCYRELLTSHLVQFVRKPAPQLRELFASLDEDGNGVLSHSEFNHAVQRVCPRLSVKQRSALLQVADADGNGVVDIFEFAETLRNAVRSSVSSPKASPRASPHSGALSDSLTLRAFKSMLRAQIPTVRSYLAVFTQLPPTSRISLLRKIELHRSAAMSRRLLPTPAAPVAIHEWSAALSESLSSRNNTLKNQAETMKTVSVESDENEALHTICFELESAEGIPVVSDTLHGTVVSRCIRVCVMRAEAVVASSNVATVPVQWSQKRPDTWPTVAAAESNLIDLGQGGKTLLKRHDVKASIDAVVGPNVASDAIVSTGTDLTGRAPDERRLFVRLPQSELDETRIVLEVCARIRVDAHAAATVLKSSRSSVSGRFGTSRDDNGSVEIEVMLAHGVLDVSVSTLESKKRRVLLPLRGGSLHAPATLPTMRKSWWTRLRHDSSTEEKEPHLSLQLLPLSALTHKRKRELLQHAPSHWLAPVDAVRVVPKEGNVKGHKDISSVGKTRSSSAEGERSDSQMRHFEGHIGTAV
ncbi:MAG: hypothetical protein MHM6MM_007770 [Cercozoa sp. M6MM]